MHFINPFKGLRPIENKASSVSIPSTDHLSEKVIEKHIIRKVKVDENHIERG